MTQVEIFHDGSISITLNRPAIGLFTTITNDSIQGITLDEQESQELVDKILSAKSERQGIFLIKNYIVMSNKEKS